jgi:hypothetical protein
MDKLKDLGEFLTGVGTMILCSTALLAFLGYRRQINRQKLRWLQQLYEKFYNQKRYKPVRQRIDFDDLDDLLPLLQKNARHGSTADARRAKQDRRVYGLPKFF